MWFPSAISQRQINIFRLLKNRMVKARALGVVRTKYKGTAVVTTRKSPMAVDMLRPGIGASMTEACFVISKCNCWRVKTS
jgi:hypothetical protein